MLSSTNFYVSLQSIFNQCNMIQPFEFKNYKRHLNDSYIKLIEKSNNYRFVDECISDVAAFKAMKVKHKIDQIRFLDREITI